MYTTIEKNQLLEFASILKVLYINDNKESDDSTKKLFENIFKDIVLMSNNDMEIKKFDNSIDLIIADLSHIDMIKELKEKNSSIDTVVILENSDPSLLFQTIELGIDGYLIKPLDKNSIYPSLLKVLERNYLKKKLDSHINLLDLKVNRLMEELEEDNDTLAQQSKLTTMKEIVEIINHLWKDSKDNKSFEKTLDTFRNFFKPNTNMSECNLSNIFDTIQTFLKEDSENHQINLNIKGDKNIKINIDENDIINIFINLINNSKDSFKTNNIKEQYIDIESIENSENIKIIYKDNSRSISPLQLQRIFKLNISSKNTIKQKDIAFYIINVLVSKYAGEITVSIQGDYTYFVLKFRKTPSSETLS